MKKLILISLCLIMGAVSLSAQKTLYIIDNETVDQFDGSQLKGKTVRDYKITTSGSGRNAITVHAITTMRAMSLPDFSGFQNFQLDSTWVSKDIKVLHKSPRKVVYVIDGERHDEATAFSSISPLDIESIKVLKDDSPEAKAYGENVSVIQIQTKKEKNSLRESLKGLPGVKVEADGSITANGQPVKKITINGRSYSVDTE